MYALTRVSPLFQGTFPSGASGVRPNPHSPNTLLGGEGRHAILTLKAFVTSPGLLLQRDCGTTRIQEIFASAWIGPGGMHRKPCRRQPRPPAPLAAGDDGGQMVPVVCLALRPRSTPTAVSGTVTDGAGVLRAGGELC